MSGISNDFCLPTCSTTMRTGLILDWRRTRQEVVQQKFALRVKARFNPFRDSAGSTIAMRWQRRLKSNNSEDQTLFLKPGQGTVHIFCEHLSPGDESACHPKPKYLRPAERNPFDAGATIWRTTALAPVILFSFPVTPPLPPLGQRYIGRTLFAQLLKSFQRTQRSLFLGG